MRKESKHLLVGVGLLGGGWLAYRYWQTRAAANMAAASASNPGYVGAGPSGIIVPASSSTPSDVASTPTTDTSTSSLTDELNSLLSSLTGGSSSATTPPTTTPAGTTSTGTDTGHVVTGGGTTSTPSGTTSTPSGTTSTPSSGGVTIPPSSPGGLTITLPPGSTVNTGGAPASSGDTPSGAKVTPPPNTAPPSSSGGLNANVATPPANNLGTVANPNQSSPSPATVSAQQYYQQAEAWAQSSPYFSAIPPAIWSIFTNGSVTPSSFQTAPTPFFPTQYSSGRNAVGNFVYSNVAGFQNISATPTNALDYVDQQTGNVYRFTQGANGVWQTPTLVGTGKPFGAGATTTTQAAA